MDLEDLLDAGGLPFTDGELEIQFDLGFVTALDETDGMRSWLKFDRIEGPNGESPRDYIEEPIITDHTLDDLIDQPTHSIAYPQSPILAILFISNRDSVCRSRSNPDIEPVEPVWEKSSKSIENRLVSLTLNKGTEVTQVRELDACD